MAATTTGGPLRRAWIWLGMVPVGMILALAIGEILPGLLGYGWTHEQDMPLGPALLVVLPTLLLFCAPGILAGWYGLRARAAGQSIGLVPAILGFLVSGYFVLVNLLALVLMPLEG